jgi:predicted membrane protein
MKKAIFLILTLLISNTILAQIEQYKSELKNVEINEILYYPFLDLTEDPPANLTEKETLIKLKEKTNSELNTLASIILNYKYADILDIGIIEQTLLEIRIIEISDKFYEKNILIFLEHSKGSPTFAEKREIFENKEIQVLLMGGGTSFVHEIDYRAKRIYYRFNERMKRNIAE